MHIVLIDGVSVFDSVRAAILAENIGRAKYKNNLKKLFKTHLDYQDFVTVDGKNIAVGASFASPVHDGYLNENKPVADLFFPAYKFGGKYWDSKVEDIYPYINLYLRNADEVAKYKDYAVKSDPIYSYAPDFAPPAFDRGEYYVKEEIFEGGVHTKDSYTIYAIPWEKFVSMGNKKFYDFLNTENRVEMRVDVAKGSWLENFVQVAVVIVMAVIIVYSAGTMAGAFAAGESIGATLAAEGATTALAATAYEVGGTFALETLGALSFSFEAFNIYNTVQFLSTSFALPDYGMNFGLNFEDKNSVTFGGGDMLGGGDDAFALPRYELPKY